MVKSISRINLNDDLLKSPSGLTYANRADSQSSLVSIDSIASIATPFESTAHGNNTSIFTTPSKRKVPGSPANAFHSVRGLFTGKRRHRADTDHFNSSMVSKRVVLDANICSGNFLISNRKNNKFRSPSWHFNFLFQQPKSLPPRTNTNG